MKGPNQAMAYRLMFYVINYIMSLDLSSMAKMDNGVICGVNMHYCFIK